MLALRLIFIALSNSKAFTTFFFVKMKIFHKINEIKEFLSYQKNSGLKIGFIPTMGALHKGHISLIERAKKENDLCVCSIFVNPIQFNNSEDLKKYPRNIENDILYLKSINCDVLFSPSEEEMYPEPNKIIYDFDGLDNCMEGAFRPGHFNGVAVVVKKLFDIIKPDYAYFGEKDYQQLVIIKYLIKILKIPVTVVPCATIRESDGLAMSSRNKILTQDERKIAPYVYKTLTKAKEKYSNYSIDELKKWVITEINSCSLMKAEYFDIVDKDTLEPVFSFVKRENCIGCIAVYLGKVRLIDNIKFL
jgi:pantoate--beta-alanine ligase